MLSREQLEAANNEADELRAALAAVRRDDWHLEIVREGYRLGTVARPGAPFRAFFEGDLAAMLSYLERLRWQTD